VPASAHAATLAAGKSCYENRDEARLVGHGFAPESQIRFAVNGRRLKELVRSDGDGDVAVFYTPARTQTERKLVIRASDEDGTAAKTTIFVTKRFAVTAKPPGSDDVRTWKAILGLYGFGRGTAFVHYANPKGRFKKTVRLGRLRRPCGRLLTSRRRVMPFRDPQYGRWYLQFDTHRRYRPGIADSKLVRVAITRG
jgi:hypothetical protein